MCHLASDERALNSETCDLTSGTRALELANRVLNTALDDLTAARCILTSTRCDRTTKHGDCIPADSHDVTTDQRNVFPGGSGSSCRAIRLSSGAVARIVWRAPMSGDGASHLILAWGDLVSGDHDFEMPNIDLAAGACSVSSPEYGSRPGQRRCANARVRSENRSSTMWTTKRTVSASDKAPSRQSDYRRRRLPVRRGAFSSAAYVPVLSSCANKSAHRSRRRCAPRSCRNSRRAVRRRCRPICRAGTAVCPAHR